MAKKKTSLIDTVRDIAKDAQALVEALKPKAEADDSLSNEELDAIRKLVKRTEDTLHEANKRAKERRQKEIKELAELIDNLGSALGVPGLDENVRKDLRDLRRRRRARLVRLQTKEALDFGGILTAPQIKEIKDVLKRAKREIARKKKAAAFLATLVRVADIALTIAAKASAAM